VTTSGAPTTATGRDGDEPKVKRARTDADAGSGIQPSDPADTAVQRLVAMGFDKAQSEAMLELTGGDVERALELLL
jgi:hypothetical protein